MRAIHSASSSFQGSNPPSDASIRHRILLVVDDEEGPRESLNIVFRDDYTVLLASNGRDAIEVLKNHEVDAAVLDIRMKEMSGIELLEKIKALDPAIEVIMLTGYETMETMRQALRLGAADYLSKPCQIETLKAAVVNAMERRSLSETIRNNNQKLEALQTELQNQKLSEEITKTRGEIYASIIHDINSPLTIISGFIQILNQKIGDAKKIEGKDLDLVRDRLKRITRQVTNCIEIAQRYLTFIRNRPSDVPFVSVNQILDDARELLMVHPAAHGNQLKVSLLAQDQSLAIHLTDVIQILLNLGINALQATSEPHNVFISAKVVHEKLDSERLTGPNDRCLQFSGFANQPPTLCLTVKDTGPGMSPEILKNIFEPYFTTKAAGGGTGLGLSIVQRLVKQAEGCIHVHSESGVGTEFNLHFPMVLKDPGIS